MFVLITIIYLIAYFNIDKTKEIYSWLHFKGTVYKLEKKHTELLSEMKLKTNLYIVANKEKRKLFVYAKTKKEEKHSLVKTYDFTSFSGKAGPKLKRGDRQIPEGIYKPVFLNSRSSYHLSIGIDYPNEFDKEKGVLDNRKDLGDEIFIHGSNVTIGCIPIGDDKIEELFVLVNHIGVDNTVIAITPNDLITYPEIKGISWENELYQDLISDISKNTK
jgi:murein L,D-transpeptidase YafK